MQFPVPKNQDEAVLLHCLQVEYESLNALHDILREQNKSVTTLPVNDKFLSSYLAQNVITGVYHGSLDIETMNMWDLYLWRIGICVFFMNYLSEIPGSMMTPKECRAYLKTCEGEIKNGKKANGTDEKTNPSS